MANMQKSQDYEEMMAKLLQGLSSRQRARIAGLTPEEVLADLAPEERMAGLTPEEQILALSDEVLRGLPEDYIDSLPSSTRQAIRRRLARHTRSAKKQSKK